VRATPSITAECGVARDVTPFRSASSVQLASSPLHPFPLHTTHVVFTDIALPNFRMADRPPASYRSWTMGPGAMVAKEGPVRRTRDHSRGPSVSGPRVPDRQVRKRFARSRVWLARARNVVTLIFLAVAYALRERRAWTRWQRRRPARWMGQQRLPSVPRQRSYD
jgi:hypothetical protein